MKSQEISDYIIYSLSSQINKLKADFESSRINETARHFIVDNFLPKAIAHEAFSCFPPLSAMRLTNTFREKKYTIRNFKSFNSILSDITFAIQKPEVIKIIESITGISNQIPDESLYAGGLSAMDCGNFLNPHIDNSHDFNRINYRTLNLLYYITPGWEIGHGGNLELWDKRVRRNTTITSSFNRLVVMETTPVAWHSVCSVKENTLRCCISNYYFSPNSPTGNPYYNVTSFLARPEQRVRRIVSILDNHARQMIRKIIPGGIARKDIYSK